MLFGQKSSLERPLSTKAEALLENIRAGLRGSCSQLIKEEPDLHDYRVIASVMPDGETGYDVAHRTGVIGQVFRRQLPLLVADAKNHPLYDSYDDSVSWELCLPLFADQGLVAVINVEGSEPIKLDEDFWQWLSSAISEQTGCRIPERQPRPDDPWRVETREIVIRVADREKRHANIAALAGVLTTAGYSTLLVGDYAELLSGRTPDMVEAARHKLAASYCCFGVDTGLDLLATGVLTEEAVLSDEMNWRKIVRGRYEYVLVHVIGSTDR